MKGLEGYFNRTQVFLNQEEKEFFENRIQIYEKYPNLKYPTSNIAYLQFSYTSCFSLEFLMQAIKTNYIRVFNGQILMILLDIIDHFQLQEKEGINHGNIQPRNIIIELMENKQYNTLTTYARIIKIKKIYFTNYILNQTKLDRDDLKYIIIEFLKLTKNRRNDKNPFSEDLIEQIQKSLYYCEIQEKLQTLLKNSDSKNQYYTNSDQETGYFAPRYYWQDFYPCELKNIKDISKNVDHMLDKVINEETMKKNFFLNGVMNQENELQYQYESRLKFREFIKFSKDQLINQFYEDTILIQMRSIGNYFAKKKQNIFNTYQIQNQTEIDNCKQKLIKTQINLINNYYDDYQNSMKNKLFLNLEEIIFLACLIQFSMIGLGKLGEIEKIEDFNEQILKKKQEIQQLEQNKSIKNIIINQEL